MFFVSTQTLFNVLIFLTATTLAFSLLNRIIVREAVRRRASRVGVEPGEPGNRRSLRWSGAKAAKKLVDYTTKHYSSADSRDMKMLRQRLIQAGVYDPHAAAYFFIARSAVALGLALGVFFAAPLFGVEGKTSFWLFVVGGGILGYLAPSSLSRSPHRGAAAGAPGRLSRFHGPARGLRRCRLEHGGGAGSGRP